MSKKKFSIFCVTEDTQVQTVFQDSPPTTCPNNVAHEVRADTVTVVDDPRQDNLSAVSDPTVNDDIGAGYGVGSRWINTVSCEEFTCADNTAGAAVWLKTVTGVFGSEYNGGVSEAESTTTSDQWQQKTRLSVTVPAGNYLVQWYWENRSSAAKGVAGRIELDDTTELGSYDYWNVDYWPRSGLALVTLTEGTHTFDVDHKITGSSCTSYIKRVRVVLWRVG